MYSSFRKDQMGVTSEYAAILTYFIGVMSMKGEYIFAVILTVFIMIILSSKEFLSEILKRISREELGTTLKFAVIALVILPLLPDAKYSFLDIAHWILGNKSLEWSDGILTMKFFNPYSIWFFVVIMAGVEYIAYILAKVMWPRWGILATGAVWWLISSTATTAAMTQKSHRKDGNTNAYVVGTLAASCIMFIRVILISWFYSPEILPIILIPACAMFTTLASCTLYLYKLANKWTITVEETQKYESPFRVAPALQFAWLILLIKFIAGVGLVYKSNLQEWFWAAAEKIYYYIFGVISWLADVDAITQTMASTAEEGKIAYLLASSTILIAVMSNNIVKASIAKRFGEKEFGDKVFYSFWASIVVGIVVIVLSNFITTAGAMNL